jgi:hypothetical protein
MKCDICGQEFEIFKMENHTATYNPDENMVIFTHITPTGRLSNSRYGILNHAYCCCPYCMNRIMALITSIQENGKKSLSPLNSILQGGDF